MNILLGITGGIAAYKSAVLLRLFQQAGHNIKVIMTDGAQEFITPKTFEGLTNEQVYTGHWFKNTKGNAHIELARWADCFIVAPATAHTLFKCAHGKADDFLTNTYLAFDRKVFFAPAMNSQMFLDPSVQSNLQTLKDHQHIILEPTSGELACGEEGIGKMMEPQDIYQRVIETLSKPSILLNKKIIVTAGPTHEYIDPVRYLSNPSTGKMGYEIAAEALRRGAQVELVSGPSLLDFHGRLHRIESATQMFEKVKTLLPCDIFVGCAAVSDYRPKEFVQEKIKKANETMKIALTKNPDILDYVSKNQRPKDWIIGFCAQTNDVLKNAKEKLLAKNLDYIVANEVYQTNKGFGSDNTTLHLVSQKNIETFQEVSKEAFAKVFWDQIENNYETSTDR